MVPTVATAVVECPVVGHDDTGHRALTIGLVAVVTLVAFEALAVITILPDIAEDLGGIAWYGWVTTAFFLGTMVGIVFAGEQADRRGAGRPYVIGLVLFAVGLTVGGLAPTMPVLVAGRFVQGLGAGVVPAIGYVAIGRVYAVEERARMFAVLSTAWVVPGIVGPALAERISSLVGWRWVFLGLLPFVAVAGSLIVPSMARLIALDTTHYERPPLPAPASRRGRPRRRRCSDRHRRVHGVAVVAAAGPRRRNADRPRSAAPADATGHAARCRRTARRRAVAGAAHVRLLRCGHVRAEGADRRAGQIDVRRQHRRDGGDAGVDDGCVDPGAPHRPDG